MQRCERADFTKSLRGALCLSPWQVFRQRVELCIGSLELTSKKQRIVAQSSYIWRLTGL